MDPRCRTSDDRPNRRADGPARWAHRTAGRPTSPRIHPWIPRPPSCSRTGRRSRRSECRSQGLAPQTAPRGHVPAAENACVHGVLPSTVRVVAYVDGRATRRSVPRLPPGIDRVGRIPGTVWRDLGFLHGGPARGRRTRSKTMAQHVTFEGAGGQRLVGLLDAPDGDVIMTALFAHCFTCGKDSIAAARIARALTARGFAVLRFDVTGLGESEGTFGEATFSMDVADLSAAADFLRARGQG